jgi:enoyl-CoA hydratase
MSDEDAAAEQVVITRDGGIARVTLNNPRRKNAITVDMAARIEEFCDRVEVDETIGAVLLDGAGEYFCSGADTRVLAASSADPASPQAVASVSAVYRAFTRIGSLPVPSSLRSRCCKVARSALE